MGGIGKTLLAIELGRACLARYPDGVFFVSLAPLSAAAAIAPAILAALGEAAGGDARQALLEALRAKHMLLILDNFEHLLDGAGMIGEILQGTPQFDVVVTSRERLNLRGEHPYFLQGLDYAGQPTLAEAADIAAVRVFVQYARRVLRSFSLGPGNLAAVLYRAGWLAHDQDDFARADAHFAEGLRLDHMLGQTTRVAAVLAHRGIMARSLGQYANATALIEEGLSLARATNDRASIAFTLFRLGVVTRERGDYARAAAIYQECMEAYRALNDRVGVAFVLLGIADLARDQGCPDQIEAPCREALALGREIGQGWITGFALNNLALAALMQGRLQQAEALAAEALGLFQAHSIRGGVVELLITCGQIAAAAGALEQARERLAEGVRHGWPTGPHWLVATGLEELAGVELSSDNAAHGVRLYAAATAWRAAMGTPLQPYRRAGLDRLIDTARLRLGEPRFSIAWAKGSAWPPGQAVAAAIPR